jgi:hypothetical protein
MLSLTACPLNLVFSPHLRLRFVQVTNEGLSSEGKKGGSRYPSTVHTWVVSCQYSTHLGRDNRALLPPSEPRVRIDRSEGLFLSKVEELPMVFRL